MYALVVFTRNVRMTLPAGFRYVRFENRGAGFRRGRYVVTVMTIGAHGGFLVAVQNSASVDALLIRNERTVTDPGPAHHRAAAVARAASLCNVRSVDRGSGITRRKHRRHVTANRVTIKTTGGIPPVLNGSRVKPVIVGLVRLSVELSATEIGKCLTRAVTSRAIKRGRILFRCALRVVSCRRSEVWLHGQWAWRLGSLLNERGGLRLDSSGACELTDEAEQREEGH